MAGGVRMYGEDISELTQVESEYTGGQAVRWKLRAYVFTGEGIGLGVASALQCMVSRCSKRWSQNAYLSQEGCKESIESMSKLSRAAKLAETHNRSSPAL